MTKEITNEELAELKSIAELASPGPWSGDRYDGSVKYEVLDSNGDTVIRGDNRNMSDGGYGIENEHDEKYILAMHPKTILALIAKVESLEADAGLRKAVGAMIKAKGRYHTEQNYAAVVVAYDAAMAKEPKQ